MTNCKTCFHFPVCKKAIKDFNTYRVCKEYIGGCDNCDNKLNLFFFDICRETGFKCEDIRTCGLWEEKK